MIALGHDTIADPNDGIFDHHSYQTGLAEKSKRHRQNLGVGHSHSGLTTPANQAPLTPTTAAPPPYPALEPTYSTQRSVSPTNPAPAPSLRHESPSGALAALASAAAAASHNTSPRSPTSPLAKPAQEAEHAGSCPGGGVCNGLGGKSCCQGCPAFNNRVLYAAAKGAKAEGAPEGTTDDGDGGMQCFNCETSKSSPARRHGGEAVIVVGVGG